jgi:uncharacterized repeat protein (TIGR01451 family)
MKKTIINLTRACCTLLLFSVFLLSHSVFAQNDGVKILDMSPSGLTQQETLKAEADFAVKSPVCSTHLITFLGSTYNGTNTTFNYQITGGGPPALSHWVVELCVPCSYVVSAGPGSVTCGTDPTTGVYGLKFDSGLGQGQTQNYWITLSGQWPTGNITAAIKAGQINCFYTIQGPTCEPDIKVVKTALTPTYSTVGDVIQYSIVVTNTGFFPLTNVTVNDPLTGLNVTIPSLAAGASQTFPTSYTVVYGDICNSQCDPKVYNTVTATGYYQQAMVTDTDDETVNGTIIPVYLNVPQAYTTMPCMSMNDIQQAFSTWINDVTYGGGCDPQLISSQTGTLDVCGGIVTVTWTVNSACQQPVVESSTFTVSAPSEVISNQTIRMKQYSACDICKTRQQP